MNLPKQRFDFMFQIQNFQKLNISFFSILSNRHIEVYYFLGTDLMISNIRFLFPIDFTQYVLQVVFYNDKDFFPFVFECRRDERIRHIK